MGDHRRESYNAQQGDPASTPLSWVGNWQDRFGRMGDRGQLAPNAPDFNTLLQQWASGSRIGDLLNTIRQQPVHTPGVGPNGAPTGVLPIMQPGGGNTGAPLQAPVMGQVPVAPVVPPVLPPSNGAPAMGQPAPAMGGLGQGPQVSISPAAAALAQALAARSVAGGIGGGARPLLGSTIFG